MGNKEDMLVWVDFLDHFSGRAFWQDEFILERDFCLFTDAAAPLGFASVWGSHWYAASWPISG